jgi:hypothetical protein
MSFIVLALPRSRTYWCSRFLSYLEWHCGHDELQHMRSLEDCATWFTQPNIGTVETAAAPFWRLIPPGLRIATVRRNRQDVFARILSMGPQYDVGALADLLLALDRKLDQIEARIPGVLRIPFDDLETEAGCGRLFEHCLPYPHDTDWWWRRSREYISGDFAAQVRYAHAYLPAFLKLAGAAKQATLAELQRKRSARPSLDGFTFAEEPNFDQWLEDAQPLFRAHLAQTDQDSESYALKNLPLGRQLHAAGIMQITTARQNGRMFGYSMAVIGPTLDARDTITAQMLLPFASPDCPGLGRRIHSAAIAILRTKGVTQFLARAGVRGDGPRLGKMYERLGFVDDGTLHRLDL